MSRPKRQLAFSLAGAAGEMVKAARERKGWSQRQLADKVLMQHPTLNRLEMGRGGLAAWRIADLCDALDLDAYELCDALRTDWLVRT